MSLDAVLAVSAGDLLIGSTVLLGSGTLVAGLAAAPVHRQRAAELSVFATLVWLALALVPLPRWPLMAANGPPAERDDVRVSFAGASTSDAFQATSAHASTASALDASPTSAASSDATALREGDAADLSAARRSRTWLGWLGLAYAAGSVIAAAYAGLGLVLVRRLLSRSLPPPPWLATLFEERCRALGVRRVRLLLSGRCRPLSAGVLRPTVVLPRVMIDPARGETLRRVLDHELVHVRRRDGLGRSLFAVAAPVLWGHPLFWWLRARASLAAELIADDGAAGETGRRAYARGLLALAEELQSLRPAPGIAPGTFRNRSELARRIEMLIEPSGHLATTCTPKRRAVQAATMLLAVGACAAAFGVRSLPAQEQGHGGKDGGGDVAIGSGAAPRDVAAHDSVLGRPFADRDARPPRDDGRTSTSDPSGGTRPDEDAGLLATAGEGVAARTAASRRDLTSPVQEPIRQQQEPDPGYAATLALVDRTLTLRSELELARAGLEGSERIRVRDLANDPELRRAVLTLQALERRLEAVLILVQSEIEATQIELAQVQQAMALGTAGPSAQPLRVRLAARLKVLQSIR